MNLIIDRKESDENIDFDDMTPKQYNEYVINHYDFGAGHKQLYYTDDYIDIPVAMDKDGRAILLYVNHMLHQTTFYYIPGFGQDFMKYMKSAGVMDSWRIVPSSKYTYKSVTLKIINWLENGADFEKYGFTIVIKRKK